jgi:hypothetical protein
MSALILLGSLGPVAGWAHAENDQSRRAAQFEQECADIAPRIKRDLDGLELHFRTDGRTQTSRGQWDGLTGPQQILTIWMSAHIASCAAGERMMVDVEIIDENGEVLRLQPVSTKLECHGDLVGPPGTPWYPC